MDTQNDSTFSISCSDVPESLFEGETAVTHFEKFGIVTKITLQPKKKSCIIEYQTREAADKAILNAGAFDGFMFDVKLLKKRRPKTDDDPEWLPDPDVAAELAAMSRNQPQVPRLNRQQKMDIDAPSPKKVIKKVGPKLVKRKKSISKSISVSKPVLNVNKDALISLISTPWISLDDKLKAIDVRDKMLRKHSKNRHGALKGCCPDMCPEKERLLRESQRQVAVYEFESNKSATYRLDPKLAVKEYSRSSADQEEPLPHELRPVHVLHQTLLYLLHHIVDLSENAEESELGDWFHFMWDRLRAIRKDIAQQALCCEGSVALVEACARFHAHCAARLIQLPSSSFDQRLNTENLLKCLQSLKYMYNDLRNRGEANACINEPEFRAYVILLNLHDSNFMWEVQRLEEDILSSPEVSFAIKVFIALDNNNYVKFFKLVNSTTYLNACILMRYFDDVRVRAIKRMIKAYSPRGVSYFPAFELMETLSFEDMNIMENFLIHYGIQIHYNDANIPLVAFDKSTFINNEDSYSQGRAVKYVEGKKKCSLGETIYGKPLPFYDFESYTPHSSFDENNYFKRSSVLAEDQGNLPASNLVAEVNAIFDNTVINKTSEPKETPIAKIVSESEKKFDFVFAEPKIIEDPNFTPGFPIKTNIPVKTNNVSGSIFPSPFAQNSGNNIFDTNQRSDFNFNKPIPVNTTNYTQHAFESTNVFGSKANSNFSNPFFVPKTETKLFNAPENFTMPKPFDQANNIFGSKTETFKTNIFSNYDIEKEKERERQEAEKKKLAEEERLEKIRKEMQIQEELRKKMENEKIELERKKELERLEELKRIKEIERKNAEKKRLEELTEKQSNETVMEIIDDYTKEICKEFINECERQNEIDHLANTILQDLCTEISKEESTANINIETRLYEIRTRLLSLSVISKWKCLVQRARKRHSLLNSTPMWLHSQQPLLASHNQSDVLQRMRDFHRGKIHTFKISNDSDAPNINVFDEVKKYLLQRSNEIKNGFNIYWKVVLVLPSNDEYPEYSEFFRSWTKSALGGNQKNYEKHILHLSENYWLQKFHISISRDCDFKKSIPANIAEGMNGLIVYDMLNDSAKIVFRLKNLILNKKKYDNMPLALILVSLDNQDTKLIEDHLSYYKKQNNITKFKIFTTSNITDDSLLIHTKRALKWLALNFPRKPSLKCNILPSFLNECIGNELLYRFKLALNSSIRGAFENINTVINIYNEAIDRTVNIACNDHSKNYPSVPREFKKFIRHTVPYPRDYEYFPENWNNDTTGLKNMILSFKMPQYVDKWPPSSWSSFQESIKRYVNGLNWYKDNDSVFLKVLTLFINVDTDSIEDGYHNEVFQWLDVMDMLVKEKISLMKKDIEVFYNIDDLECFRTTPWWYKSVYTKNVPTYVEDVDINFLENTLDDLGISCVKKKRIDESLETIPDEEWLSQTVAKFDNSFKEVAAQRTMFEELEKSVVDSAKKQAEIEAFLKSVMGDV